MLVDVGAALPLSLTWTVAPLRRASRTHIFDGCGDESLESLLSTSEKSSDIEEWEFFFVVRNCAADVTRLIRCPTEYSASYVCLLMQGLQKEFNVNIQGLAVPRCRGGKGGFGKNLAKKGRLYIKAQRRGETNANLNQLGRNLRGERIGGDRNEAAGHNATGDQGRVTPAVRQVPQEVQEAYAEVRRDHEHKTHEREAFAKTVRDAVIEGFRMCVHTVVQERNQQPKPAAGDQ